MDVVAPISAAVWAPRGQRASISGRGEASVSSGLTDPASMAPSPSFEIRGLLHGGVVEAGRFTPGRGEGDDAIAATVAAADGDMDEGQGGAAGPVKKRGIEPRT